MNVLVLTHVHPARDASKPTRNGIVHPVRDAKADWRNGIKNPTTEDKQMATVTYRGVEYDTEEYNAKVVAEAAKRERHELMYRGLKVKSKAVPCS